MNPTHFQRVEHKYIFPAGQKEMILDWLEHALLPDPSFDIGAVSSLYYDTPSLTLYNEKRNGDFLKNKVRLRWYTDLRPEDQTAGVRCFLEIKRKYGALCQKKRMEVLIASERLVCDPFSDEQILNLPSRVFDLDYLPPGILVPMLLVQYNRCRFVEPESGSRIAVDAEIRCDRANETFFPGLTPVSLGAGVLEVKGKRGPMPHALSTLHTYLTKSEYSKYALCLEHMMQPLGRSV